MNQLTQQEAFQTMIAFLEAYYQQTKADDIGALLGSLQLLEDGTPTDPAMWQDWIEAYQSVMYQKDKLGV
ncbi:MAG: hypothetical protein AB4058_03120 [Microcystaceae cyanobacterium]